MNNCSLAGFMLEEPSIIIILWPIGAMLPHVQRAYYIVHALALAKLICAVLYSTRIAYKVAWHLSATVFSGSPAYIYLFIVLEGKTPLTVRPTFLGASLIALNKKRGGVRPIAVGLSLRWLAAKCLANKVQQFAKELLVPLQLGFGTSCGAEAAAYSSHLYLHNMPSTNLFLKLDFKNALNSLR